MSAQDHGLARSLFPELEKLVAGEDGRGGEPDPVEVWIADAVRRLRADEIAEGLSEFSSIADASARRRVRAAFEATCGVVSAIGLVVPTLDEFVWAGADAEALGAAMGDDDTLMAVPAPYGLGHRNWVRIFEGQAEVRPGSDRLRLSLASEAERWFAALDQVPDRGEAAVRPSTGPGVPAPVWTLRLIPAARTPPNLQTPYHELRHPSLPEMSMLHLIVQATGRAPIDDRTFTWLAGDLPGSDLAARVIMDTSSRSLRVGTRAAYDRGPHVGGRPPMSVCSRRERI